MKNFDFLFIYGTLLQGTKSEMHQVLKEFAHFYCHAEYQGKMFNIDWYPGIIPSDNIGDKVKGQVYRFKPSSNLLALLDEYEGCSDAFEFPHEYKRVRAVVKTENSEIISTWVYLYNWDTQKLEEIKSGDYLAYLKLK